MRTTTITALLLAAALPLAACSGGSGTAKPAPRAARPETAAPSSAPVALSLGQGAQTTGAGGKGVLEVTPTSVVYATKASIDKPARELFAVVTVKDRPTTAVAGAESAPIDGGGWQWVAPDGQAISGTDGNASNVVLEGFQGNPTTQPGTFSWGTQAFDITTAQRGGTLIYTDGTGVAHRWKVPAQDAGPQAAQVRKALAG